MSLTKGVFLGSGAYGKLYTSKYGESKVAVKCNFKDEHIDGASSLKELDINANLVHEHVLSVSHVVTDLPFKQDLISPIGDGLRLDSIHFCMPPGVGSLSKYLHELKRPLNLEEIRMFTCHMLLGLEYAHSLGIMHRDLKPSNMILFQQPMLPAGRDSGSMELKLGDWGLAEIHCNIKQSRLVMSYPYRAPDVILSTVYDLKADIWSIGCILYELVADCRLINVKEDNNAAIIKRIVNVLPKKLHSEDISRIQSKHPDIKQDKKRKSFLSRIKVGMLQRLLDEGLEEKELSSLLNGLLAFRPTERLSATEALNLSFFEPHRKYIEVLRSRHTNTVPLYRQPMPIYNCSEKVVVTDFILFIFDSRIAKTQGLKWCSDRVLFSSVSLCNLYIACSMISIKKKPADVTSKDRLVIPDRANILGTYLWCLYMMVKYHSIVDLPMSLAELIKSIDFSQYRGGRFKSGDFLTRSVLKSMISLEQKIIKANKFTIYRETPYDVAMRSSYSNTPSDIKDLLIFYCSFPASEAITGQEIYESFLKQKNVTA